MEPVEKRIHPGQFKKGFDPRRDANPVPPSRRPGQTNVITRDLKRGIIDAAERYGSDGKGTDGLTGYLFHLAGKHPKAFAGLLGKILPLQISGNVGQFIGTVNVISVPADSFLSADDMNRLTAPAALDHEPSPADGTESQPASNETGQE